MKNNKHSFEFKVKIVDAYLNKEASQTFLSQKYNVSDTLIQTWVN